MRSVPGVYPAKTMPSLATVGASAKIVGFINKQIAALGWTQLVRYLCLGLTNVLTRQLKRVSFEDAVGKRMKDPGRRESDRRLTLLGRAG